MKLLRIIILCPLALFRLFMIIFISAFVVFVGFIWLKSKGFSRHLQQWVMRTWGKTILFFLGVKIIRNEIPKHSNYLLMPNHRSYLDIFIVAGLTPLSLIGKAELKNWPFGQLGTVITNSILVDINEIRSLIRTMNQIKKSLKQGIPVGLFPEGTTSRGPLTIPFKNGSFKIAADSNVPVIPMAIHYKDLNDAWVGNDTFLSHFFRQMGKLRTCVYLKYGTPILNSDYKILQKETRNQIDLMLEEIIQKNLK